MIDSDDILVNTSYHVGRSSFLCPSWRRKGGLGRPRQCDAAEDDPRSDRIRPAGGAAPFRKPLPRYRLALPPLAHSLRERA